MLRPLLRLTPPLRHAFSFSARPASSAASAFPLSQADISRLTYQRNIGVSAHIDSGKTTLTERILFYTGRIRDIHEVRGRDAVGAKMDSMDLEREKGITIQSAATFCDWEAPRTVGGGVEEGEKDKYAINIIDTPGHVDFTIEVERALRVLDGAILVLCAVSGVQSQTTTVDRQMRRYGVPRISFINKMDRPGANPTRIIQQIRTKLRIAAAAVHIPVGAEDAFEGVVDLVTWRAIRYTGNKGIDVTCSPIPASLLPLARQKRTELIEVLSDVDDVLCDLYLASIDHPSSSPDQPAEPNIGTEELSRAIRRATVGLKFTPVFLGSAIKNKGVQTLLDGVCAYLPDPSEARVVAVDVDAKPSEVSSDADADADPSSPATATTTNAHGESQVLLTPSSSAPFVGLAFKLEESRFGQLTYIRVYQGTLRKAGSIWNVRTGKKVNKVPRLVRMHSDEMEDIESIGPGEICAIFGVECSSGDTFTDGTTHLSMTSMYVPEPVISLAIKPKGQETPNFSRALNRFQKEDPTFKVSLDPTSKETIISGMGELHLEIYVERMKREYNVECTTGKPLVAFRECITQRAEFNYTHKKQTGGAGQFAKVIGFIEPITVPGQDPSMHTQEGRKEDGERKKLVGGKKEGRKDVEFESQVMGGTVPTNFIPGCEVGFLEACEKGTLSGNVITNTRLVLTDGAHHVVDSSDLAFKLATIGAFREAFKSARPVILEPIMTVEVVSPAEYQNAVIGSLNMRRGTIVDSEVREEEFVCTAEVALNDMFGYSNMLRGSTQGKGEFSMEYKNHMPVLPQLQKELEDAYRRSLPGGTTTGKK